MPPGGTYYECIAEGGGGIVAVFRESRVPVNLYRSDRRLILAAPLPGVEPEDIEVEVTPHSVTFRTRVRGVRQNNKEYITREWEIGSHERTVPLPETIDPQRANVSYGNGVLAVVMPQVQTAPGEGRRLFRLHKVRWARGQFVGHQGQELRPAPAETAHRLP
ncbi:MAG TPA: Hsp20/alpha crystallin family protein [Dehalococcoidia bacterium]|nr:Hsp20/alpha crystallin family protein [Dehalococcoidia bacterium]